MTNALVVIRTYANLAEADHAQVDLLSAGIYSLLLTDQTAGPGPRTAAGQSIALAVHDRDVHVAEAILIARPYPPV